ncbi:MAG: DNA polymerase III subunit beta [Methylococcaceae bacterium]|jgi:DNA polymerase-3 subunit beta|nr:DNA polymerase III subunit beta [Methylococcaceae bacterium]
MKLSIARETLLTPLSQVTGVIEKRQTLPILSNVLLQLSGGQLEMTGTDLEVQLLGRVQVDSNEEGAITVPARKLLDIFRLLPERSDVTLEHVDDRLSIRSGRSRFNLTTLPVENYPAFDSGSTDLEINLPSDSLRSALDKTIFAMAQQDVRSYLNGLLIDLEGHILRTVASDGHRLAVFQESLPSPFTTNRQIIVPRKGIQELSRLLGDADDSLTIQISPNTIRVNLGQVTFSAKLIEGRYPDYQRVMPGELSHLYQAGKEELKAALSRASLLTSEKQKSVSLEVDETGLMILKAHNSEHEEAEESLMVDAQGGSVSVGFNAGYLLDAINHIDSEQVRLSFTDVANSCLVEDKTDARFKYVVMPMRL